MDKKKKVAKKKKVLIASPPLSKAESVKVFLKNARLDLINAVRSACKNRFPLTVAVLDGLSASETEAVTNGGLLSLPKPKILELEKAMKSDDFVWS